MVGEVLGNRYKLLREIGAGGMAWVYLAEDLVEKSQVAVKVLYPQFSQDMSYVQRFIREAKLAIQISSDHIVRILNYGADRDVHYLVMEYIQGQDLASTLRKRGPLPWREALEIAAQVALALEAANSCGVVHRDIKPQNIMLTQDGLVKVLDFGIARARTLPSLTQTGFVGSPSYIAPEQAMGEEVDIRSDIYSLGVVLYEMLSGKLPFEATTPWSIISQHIANKPPALSMTAGDLPPAVEELVNKMLAKDPDDRYQTPGELLAAIEAALRGRVGAGKKPLRTPRIEQAAALSKAHRLLLSSLYERAVEAEQAEEWPQAVNLFNRILKVDPQYRDVSERLAYAGLQARLAALYAAAQKAMQEERWQEAVDELSEIIGANAEYRDAAALLTQASRALAEEQAHARIARLYEEGLTHYQAQEWERAEACLRYVFDADPNYEQVAQIYPKARRRARWARSLLGRMASKAAGLVGKRQEE